MTASNLNAVLTKLIHLRFSVIHYFIVQSHIDSIFKCPLLFRLSVTTRGHQRNRKSHAIVRLHAPEMIQPTDRFRINSTISQYYRLIFICQRKEVTLGITRCDPAETLIGSAVASSSKWRWRITSNFVHRYDQVPGSFFPDPKSLHRPNSPHIWTGQYLPNRSWQKQEKKTTWPRRKSHTNLSHPGSILATVTDYYNGFSKYIWLYIYICKFMYTWNQWHIENNESKARK